jgi:hypothetical protein
VGAAIKKSFWISWANVFDYIRANPSRMMAVMGIARHNLSKTSSYFVFAFAYFEQFRRYISSLLPSRIVQTINMEHSDIPYHVSRFTHTAYDIWQYIREQQNGLRTQFALERAIIQCIYDAQSLLSA